MFEVGVHYQFHMSVRDEECSFGGIIQSIDLPLIKLKDIHPKQSERKLFGDQILFGDIINVHSPYFIKASRNRDQE